MKTNDLINQTIDVEAILREIRRKIKEKGFSKDTLSFQDNFDDVFLSLIPKDIDVMDIGQQLDILRNSWNIQPNKPLNGNRLVVLIKRVIRKLTRFFILPIVNEQNAINYSVFLILEKNCEMKTEIENLHDRIIQLEKEVKRFPVDCNQVLLFQKSSFTINYLVKGFSDPEDNLTWTDQEISEINIPISFINTDLKLIIQGNKFIPSQTIEVIINNCNYGKIESHNSEFVIKANEFLERKYLNIKFIVSKPYSPKELGIGDDVRTLGFALIAISLNAEVNREAKDNG